MTYGNDDTENVERKFHGNKHTTTCVYDNDDGDEHFCILQKVAQ